MKESEMKKAASASFYIDTSLILVQPGDHARFVASEMESFLREAFKQWSKEQVAFEGELRFRLDLVPESPLAPISHDSPQRG